MVQLRRRAALAAWGVTLAAVASIVLAPTREAVGAPANLIPNGSFEGTLAGWTGLTGATLSLASDGVVGAQAARAALPSTSTSTSFGLIATPPVVPLTQAAQLYNAGGWVRSDAPGFQVCLRVRERQADGTYLYSQSCVTTTASWQVFPTLAYTTAAAGDRLDVYVSAYGAPAGASFEVDGLTLGGDTTPPETSIDSGPAAYASTADASFAFSSTEPGSTFVCGVDAPPVAACSSPQTYAGLADGAHTFQVAAVDAAGNVDPTPASAPWTIDTSGRLLRNGSFEGSLVGWTALNSNLGLAADGTAGRQAATAALLPGSTSTSFGLITSPPAIASATAATILNAAGWVRSDTPGRMVCLRIREREADGTYLYGQSCVTSSLTWQEFPIVAYTPVATGDRIDVYVSAYGALPGDSFEVDGVSLGGDVTPPETTIASGPADYTDATDASFTFSANEAGSTFQCSLDGLPAKPCVSPQAYAGLADGLHRFRVAAVDPAGNVDPTPAPDNWTIDTSGVLLHNGSFEGSTVGWAAFNATLGVAADGIVGRQAAIAALASGSTATSFGLFASPPAVAAADGRTYQAGGWVRSDKPGNQACLKIRERQADGTYLYGSSCVVAKAAWQQFPPVSYPVVTVGDRVDVYVLVYGAVAGDTVEADGMWLKPVLAPPVATAPPTIAGTPRDGETLTASTGTWVGTRPIATSFEWRLCDASGAACADVAGATGSTLALGPDAVGHTLQVYVTAKNADGSTDSGSAMTAVVTAAGPVATTAPSIAGTAQNGSKLTGSTGAWSGTPPIAVAGQWRRCDATGAGCVDIAGATGTDYVVTFADVGHTLVFAVTATNAGGSATATAPPSAVAVDTDQPSFPIRAAFYYPWYPNAWKQNGMNPYTHYHPALGTYDSSAQNVIQTHLDALRHAHVQVGISSWWSIGDDTDQNFPLLLRAAAGTSFRWAVYYEPEGQGNPTADQIRADLVYIRDHYGSDPSYLRIGGRFVVFAFDGGPNDTLDGCALNDRWKAANTVGAYVVLKVFNGFRQCTSQPDGWHQYAPANAASSVNGFAYTISPGFWRGSLAAPNLVRDPTRWNQNVRDMIASGAPWQLIATFNEWGEGSAVENAQEWTTASGYGTYVDALNANGLVNGAAPPANVSPPVAGGVPNTEPGAIVGALPGVWSGSPTAYAYQWRSCDSAGMACTEIVGANGVVYQPTLADIGSTLRVVVTASNAGGAAVATSLQTSVVVAGGLPDTAGVCTGAAPPARWAHVIWIWMENKGRDQVLGSPAAPYENQLAAACGTATAYKAVAHPSLPNYIAATSGDTWGITDDAAPASHPLAVPSVYSQVTAAGLAWREYAESAPGPCPKAAAGSYVVKHDPAPYYTGIAADCAAFDVPAGTLAAGVLRNDLAAGTLPSYAVIVPNLCNDTHQCPVQAGDDWLRAWLPLIFASPAYASGTTAVFVVWDENDGSSGNLVPFFMAAPSTVAGTRSAVAFNHYSLLRTTEEMLGLDLLGKAATATSMRAAFGLGP